MFSSNLIQRASFWTTWKNEYSIRNCTFQHQDTGDTYTVWFYDGPEVHCCTIWKMSVPDGVLAQYSQIQNDEDLQDFETNYLPVSGRPIEQRNTDHTLKVVAEPRIGTEVIYGTHNFADKTTWAADSIRVTEETATDSGDGLTFTLAHAYVIDNVHGKVFDEDQYARDQRAENPDNPHAYAVVVTVDDVEVLMREPLEETGGDYTVNYVTGTITFFESQANKTVKVSYSYATTSTFYITPDPGFDLDIEKAKAMWSADFGMTDSVRFEIFGYAAVFAPQLGLPAGTKIPLTTTEYRTLTQLTSEASEYQANAIPASGGATRGISQARHATYFRYGTIRRLISAAGIELRVRTGHHRAMDGEFATATFYCVVRPVT